MTDARTAAALGAGLAVPAAAKRRSSLLPGEARALVLEAAGKRLVDELSLDLEAGPLSVIMGPNGAGKSLLLRLLHGLIQPSRGTVRWGGEALGESVRKRQAMVFQRPVLLRRTVAANLDFVLRLRGPAKAERVAALLDHVGLAGHAEQPARQLSGGEQQRLALARAIALEPEVLFLDEPTANLDPASTARIEAIVLAAQRRGTKIVFVTHDLGQARRLADEIVFLHRGRVVEQAPAERFLEQPESAEARHYLAGKILL